MKLVIVNNCFLLSTIADFCFQSCIYIPVIIMVYDHCKALFSVFIGFSTFAVLYRLIFLIYLSCEPMLTLPPYMAFKVCRLICTSMLIPAFALAFCFDQEFSDENEHEHNREVVATICLFFVGLAHDVIFILLAKHCVIVSQVAERQRSTVHYYDNRGHQYPVEGA
ncbi:hypothetical protein L596_009884 [Steinernema carpocapsae]|uniref:Uncharacterized protein n=1 Tax=Steinernema carpocapsae TaxID=34508 RepID=A0A4U5PGV9_STECR|nr:hypothetical protein L596_009884 [Steinernema carpocapsae]